MNYPEYIMAGITISCLFLLLLFRFAPRYGCLSVVVFGLGAISLVTKNGLVLIGGGILVAVVFVIMKYANSGDINIDIDGNYNNVTINK